MKYFCSWAGTTPAYAALWLTPGSFQWMLQRPPKTLFIYLLPLYYWSSRMMMAFYFPSPRTHFWEQGTGAANYPNLTSNHWCFNPLYYPVPIKCTIFLLWVTFNNVPLKCIFMIHFKRLNRQVSKVRKYWNTDWRFFGFGLCGLLAFSIIFQALKIISHFSEFILIKSVFSLQVQLPANSSEGHGSHQVAEKKKGMPSSWIPHGNQTITDPIWIEWCLL